MIAALALDPHSIGVLSFFFSLPGRSSDSLCLSCIDLAFLNRGNSLRLIFGVACPHFRFYTPCRGAEGPDICYHFSRGTTGYPPCLRRALCSMYKSARELLNFLCHHHPSSNGSFLGHAELKMLLRLFFRTRSKNHHEATYTYQAYVPLQPSLPARHLISP